RVPIALLGKHTRRRGVLLAVDGAHGPGAFHLDFSELEDVDFYGGNLHKWMMGPKGTGFGWLPKRHRDKLRPVMAGWTTFETPIPFQGFGGGDRHCARMLMAYCLDFANFFALSDLIDWWRAQGPERIFQALRENRNLIANSG
ncbi:MAG: aminotransferase class V-fold PLP-dependent enzyme, partial [Bdellovibrionaceae bacterium]|nr:aminotransferase class V-fold PLP-dependent enzyme [Pseudobdellovibrionaceae bacterium]